MTLVSVVPLVTTRSLARPFTYRLDGADAGPGAVVEVRLGGARRRGVVVEAGVEAPEGVSPAPVERVVGQLPPALVELALWLAEYYGSTPGRALALVAPPVRRRRGERRAPVAREALSGEAEPRG